MFPFLIKLCNALTPFTFLTSQCAKLTEVPLGKFTQWLIQKFIKTYNIDLTECENPDLSSYKTFNEFFTRRLKVEARLVDFECTAVSPVDGTVGQAGDIKASRLIQAKGIDYSLNALLGGNNADVEPFKQGQFACIYLSPANYHRIHMPIDGTLVKTIHIPGTHFPVGRKNVAYMPDLFTRNERLVCFFQTEKGMIALVMVGAAMVGSIATPWAGTLVRRKGIEETDFSQKNLFFKRGDEIGMFKFGSTVITVWPEQLGKVKENIVNEYVVRMGEALIVEN